MHNCHIRRHLDAQPNRKNEYNVGMYRIALLVWLWGVWGLLLAIPILGIVKVVSHHPPYDVVLSARRRTPYLSIEFLNTIFLTIAIFLRSLSCRGMGITLFAQAFKLLLQDF